MHQNNFKKMQKSQDFCPLATKKLIHNYILGIPNEKYAYNFVIPMFLLGVYTEFLE